jgi:hypothetical protein
VAVFDQKSLVASLVATTNLNLIGMVIGIFLRQCIGA